MLHVHISIFHFEELQLKFFDLYKCYIVDMHMLLKLMVFP